MDVKYCAVFEYADDGINIFFPDVPEAFTCAFSKKEAIKMAKDVLELILHGRRLFELPVPTPRDEMKKSDKEEVVEIFVCMDVKDGILVGNDIIDFE